MQKQTKTKTSRVLWYWNPVEVVVEYLACWMEENTGLAGLQKKV